MSKPFKIKGRDGWHAEVTKPDGSKQRYKFDRMREAQDWLDDQVYLLKQQKAPLFGGPSGLTLGRMLGEYAARFTVTKGGYEAELTRVNNYVLGAGLPRLEVQFVNGQRHLVALDPATAPPRPKAFTAHLEMRRAKRQRTYARIAQLGATLVSRISTDDLQALSRDMTLDGLSKGTIQKEFALLKHAFNIAIQQWNWRGFENPALPIKLGRSNTRFVILGAQQETRLFEAVARCDNPQVWPLVSLAILTTLRKGSLLKMRWDSIDFETGRIHVWAKGRMVNVPLSNMAIEVLRDIPRTGELVFSMSSNAVQMAWEGIRQNAGMPDLFFSDLRHVGATFYAKAGMGVHELKEVLSHTTTRMAEVYVNLTTQHVQGRMNEIDAVQRSAMTRPPAFDPSAPQKKPRRGKNTEPTAPVPQTNVVEIISKSRKPTQEAASDAPQHSPFSALVLAMPRAARKPKGEDGDDASGPLEAIIKAR